MIMVVVAVQVVRMMLCVVAAFLVCWTPYQAMVLLADAHAITGPVSMQRNLHFSTRFLSYANGAVNPFIYSLMHAGIRKELQAGPPSPAPCSSSPHHHQVSACLSHLPLHSHISRHSL
ncbi:C3a anaphylatoxin chemotactic receptor-like [Lampetra planeri]